MIAKARSTSDILIFSAAYVPKIPGESVADKATTSGEDRSEDPAEPSRDRSFLIYLADRLLPRFFRSWQGVVAAALAASLALYMGTDLRIKQESVEVLGDVVLLEPGILSYIVPGAIVMAMMLLRLHYDFRNSSREVTIQRDRIVEFEHRAEHEPDFLSALKAQLELTAERAKLLMLKAKARAGMLFSVGTGLTIISAFTPIVSIAVYVTFDPLPQTTLASLELLRTDSGELPAGLSISVAKDWRVLISGISFGFLFLAAATALFTQHRRQVEASFALAKDVDYFNALISAVEIRNRSDKEETLSDSMSELVDGVVDKLVEKKPASLRAGEDENDNNAALGQLTDIIKQLKS